MLTIASTKSANPTLSSPPWPATPDDVDGEPADATDRGE